MSSIDRDKRLIDAIGLETTSSGRPVKMTAKARDYHAQLELQHLSRVFKKLKTSMDDGRELLQNDAPLENVRQVYRSWLMHYEEFNDAYHRLKQQEGSDSINEARMKDLRSFKTELELYFISAKMETDMEAHVSASQVSAISNRSSTVVKQRLFEIERNAELAAEMATLKEKQKLEAAELELKQRIEENRLRTSLIASNTKKDALKELDVTSVVSNETSNNNQHRVITRPADNIRDSRVVTDRNESNSVSDRNQSNSMDDMHKLIEAISMKNDLPVKEPTVFQGDILDFAQWLKSFETLVESRRSEARDRLYYLGLYTKGEPRDAIEGYLLLNTEEAYKDAKETLMDRYGNPTMVAEMFRKKLNDWPSLKNASGPELRKFVDFLKSCRAAIASLGSLLPLDSIQENKRILQKLPYHIVNRWNREVDIQIHDRGVSFPSFSEFVEFLKKEIRLANSVLVTKSEDSILGQAKRPNQKPKSTPGARAFASGAREVPDSAPQENNKCIVCKNQHTLENCTKFKAMSLEERKTVIKANALCYGCLAHGHRKGTCRNKKICMQCNKTHPTLLHDNNWRSNNNSKTEAQGETHDVFSHCLNCDANTRSYYYHSLIVPVQLYHVDDPDNVCVVYAMIDEQSDACFVTNSVLKKLNITGTPVEVRLSTVLDEQVISCSKATGLVVRGVKETMSIPLPGCYSRHMIPGKPSQIPQPETLRNWPHLAKVADQLLPYDKTTPIGLLVGINCVRATKPREVINGKDDEPYAIHTALGWGVIGPVRQCEEYKHCHFAYRTQVNEISPAQVTRMFDTDFIERLSGAKVSLEDKRFLDIAQKGIIYKENGHFELPLPLKNEPILPNNRVLAEKRLNGLKRKMMNDANFKHDYVNFMNDLLEKGYAEKVPSDSIDTPGNTWYIPHHAVYHSKKKRIRVVFDCSGEFQGQSLNKHLLQGPDMINNLIGVLCRFRKEQVAFTCDIEGMFNQVNVSIQHRNLLRFLWWDNAQINTEPKNYRMTTHLFGARSSPGCVNFALKTAADMFEPEFGSEAAELIRNNFYVDDGLKSVPDQQTASQLIDNAQQLCRKGGFRLHKFVANDKSVLQNIAPEDRAKDIQEIKLDLDDLPMERTLGVQWCVQSDSFQFAVELRDVPLTRRGILSTVSSIFDPLGLVSPFILTGKRILQSLCLEGLDWDDPVNEDIRMRWERWRSELYLIASLKIPRCYKPPNCSDEFTAELHHFCDASLEGLGHCTYLRIKDNIGNLSTSLVMGKARVAPSKQVTVPRLELSAAVISVKVSEFLMRELDYKISSQYFWTDSKVILGYINNDAKRFHIFVANRVQQIRDHTSPTDWRHVKTNENPADVASRGMSASDLIDSQIWWHGPDFLRDDSMPESSIPELHDSDPEIKRVTVLSTQLDLDNDDFLTRLNRFSSWNTARRAVALCIRYLKILQDRVLKKKLKQPLNKHSKLQPISVQEMQVAEKSILTFLQWKSFPNEVNLLRKISKDNNEDRSTARRHVHNLKRSSTLHRLDPFVGEDGLIRVGGRLNAANLPRDLKNPVILPKHSHISKLIIDHYHIQSAHSGRGMTLNTIRANGYWIIASNAAVTSHIWKCVICRKLRRQLQGQKMSDLPSDRLEPAPPFTYSAVDCFGPFYIREGRREMKRYGVLFTCLASRAIHIEVASSLSTDSFLNAYRRLVCRRGPIRQLRSDQGTNFVGAKGEQLAALKEMNHDKIQSELLKDECDWINFKMNVPHASHIGGVWERMIRCARNALNALLVTHASRLDEELLRTLLVEAEAIVNSRPLTYVDSGSLLPLSPQQILTLKTKVVLPPPGNFVREDMYCHRRWRRVQYLANEFWNRWRLEFIPTLQERKKWTCPQKDVAINDIVLLVDSNLPRNRWPLARVIDTHSDEDGFVRKVKVVAGQSTYERPIHKVVTLLEHDQHAY